MPRRTWTAAVMLGVVVTLAACGGGSKTAGSTITVYSGRSESLVGTLIKQFEEKFDITVKVRYGDTAELAALIAEEGGASPADVFWAQDAGALGALQEQGRFAKLDDRILSPVPAAYRSTDGRWVGASGRVRVIAFNPELVKENDVPDSVLQLTDARWKGKVGWAPTNGSFQVFVTAFRETKGDAAARAWLQAMKANGAKMFANNDAIAEAVGEGEIPLGLVNHYYPFEIVAEHPDAKIQDHFLAAGDIGGLVNVSGAGVLNTSKNKLAAQRFINYLLSADGQRYFVEKTWEYPLVPGIEADPRLPKFTDLQPPTVDLSSLGDLEGTLTLLRDVGLL
ncbi:MAG: iron ABC transporter substrate-binding protein [Actinomycetota bacterium]